MTRSKKAVALFGIIVLGLFFIKDAQAIPTFARKYRTSCTTCHNGYNKLNSFGEAFKLNGYQVPGGDAAYVKEEPVSMGSQAWRKVWPEAVWPGAIPSQVPISMMVHQRAVWNESATGTTPTVDFEFPHEWEMFVAGTLDPMISYFGEFVFYETDEGVAGAERVFVTLNDLGAGPYEWLPENALNLKIGHFDIAADPFANPTKRTLTKYLLSDYTVGSSAFKLRSRQSGLEAFGLINGRARYALGLVNGNGSLDGDDNKDKDFYYRLEYKFGGARLDGLDEAGSEGLKQTNNWRERSICLGTTGYRGKESIITNSATNSFSRLTAFLDGRYDDLEVQGAILIGRDDNIDGTGTAADTLSWIAQADYVLYPWLIGACRVESLEYKGDNSSATSKVRFIPSLSAYLRANVRLTLESVIYRDAAEGSDSALADLSFLF